MDSIKDNKSKKAFHFSYAVIILALIAIFVIVVFIFPVKDYFQEPSDKRGDIGSRMKPKQLTQSSEDAKDSGRSDGDNNIASEKSTSTIEKSDAQGPSMPIGIVSTFPKSGRYEMRDGTRVSYCTESDCKDIYQKGGLTSNTLGVTIPYVNQTLENLDDFCLPPEDPSGGDLAEVTCGSPIEDAITYYRYNNVFINIIKCQYGCVEGACVKGGL